MEVEAVEALMEAVAVEASMEAEAVEVMTRVDTAEAATTSSTHHQRKACTTIYSEMQKKSRRQPKDMAATPQVRVVRVSTFRNRNRRFDACIGQTVKWKRPASSSIRLSLARSSLNAIAAISACMFTLISHASLKTRATG